MATAGADHTVRIWDARTQRILRVIQAGDAVIRVTFTLDSRDVFSWSAAGVVREWDACTDCENPGDLMALARTRVTRELTPAEGRAFGAQ